MTKVGRGVKGGTRHTAARVFRPARERVRPSMRVALVGTYAPTACGIATFTADVESSLTGAGLDVMVVPICTQVPRHGCAIGQHDRASYVDAAHELNTSDHEMVVIEHEFGIFGGAAGSYIVDFVEALRIPFVLTLHTVLSPYSVSQRDVIDRLIAEAAVVTVFTETARRLLYEQGLGGAAPIRVIPHGAPVELYADQDRAEIRRRMGLGMDDRVLSTFGLLSPGKGIELALGALAEVVLTEPRVIYIVAGRTHPEVDRQFGEAYREHLVSLVRALGLVDNVIFVDRFLTVQELASVLSITDVFLTPYVGCEQIVSGALTFAMAAGCPVVSTPYRYAQDLLADGAGVLAPFGDSHAFAEAVISLLADGPAQTRARAAARRVAHAMQWPAVGRSLAALLTEAAAMNEARAPQAVIFDHAREGHRSSRHIDARSLVLPSPSGAGRHGLDLRHVS